MPIIAVEDEADPRLADYRNIPDPELMRARGVFVAEGRLVVTRLLAAAAWEVRSVMATAAALEAIRTDLDARPDVPAYLVPQPLMNAVAGFNIHRGCLALGARPAPRDWQMLTRGARFGVALERLGDVDNIGAIFRSAAAFDAAFVLLDGACADPLYRKAIRTSMGAALAVPFARVPWPKALHDLRTSGWAVIGATPAPHARPLRETADAVGARPALVVVGHEGDGLSAVTLEACTHLARIPTTTRVDSLNVATAAAIVLYACHEAAGR